MQLRIQFQRERVIADLVSMNLGIKNNSALVLQGSYITLFIWVPSKQMIYICPDREITQCL